MGSGGTPGSGFEGRSETLVFEPGRYLVGNAGVLLTRVEYLKPGEAKNFAIIDAAMILRDDLRFLFVFVGDGDEKPNLQKRVSEHKLGNVLFFAPIPRVDSPDMLSAADAFVLPNRKGDFFSGNLPNKLFDYLASSRPIVVAGSGETPELVMAAGAGRCGQAADSHAMANSLIELAEMPVKERMAMGKKGRDYVFKYYDRNRLSEQFLKILSDVIKSKWL